MVSRLIPRSEGLLHRPTWEQKQQPGVLATHHPKLLERSKGVHADVLRVPQTYQGFRRHRHLLQTFTQN